MATKITITNDRGRLSTMEIERIIKDAEKYKKDDEVQRNRLDSKNSLESFCLNVKQDFGEIIESCETTLKWLERNQKAEKDEYDYT